MSFYNILVFNIAVFNDLIYVSQFSSSAIYIINLISFVTTIVTFPNSIPLYRMQMDPYCNRIWFGVNNQNYSLVPIFDLNTNKAQLYQANGSLTNTKVNLVEFDSTYSMYTVETGANYFYKYKMPNINCGKL
jgi:hypothetical protein